jgi:peptide/nickel transport system substrate-binding protein
LDTYLLELVLHEPSVDFLSDLTDYTTGIVNKRAYEENPDDPTWTFIGTGPYKIVGYGSNEFLDLERNDDYWGDLPPTRNITIRCIPEQSTRLAMLQTGEAQVVMGMTPENLDIVDANPDFQVFSLINMRVSWLAFNNRGNEIVTDKNFRLAVAHALNAEDIETVGRGNWGIPAWDGNFWGVGTEFRLEGLPKWEYDPDLAREYLEKSVYSGEPLSIWVSTGDAVKIVELMQEQLRAVGINIVIEAVDSAALLEVLKYDADPAKHHMHQMGPGFYGSALKSLKTTVWPGMASNRLNIDNPYLTELLNKLVVAFDRAEREAICYEIQQFFYDDVTAIPLYWNLTAVSTVLGIGGMRLSNDVFNHDYRDIYWNLDEAPANLRP